jgi:hypothetical protein
MLLGVRVLSAGDDPAALSGAISARLDTVGERHGLVLTSRWHTGEVELAHDGDDVEAVGGELLRCDAWPDRAADAP